MICVHNVVAASAVVGLLGREGDLIRKTLIPMTWYALFAGTLGLVFLYGIGANLGTLLLMLMLAFLGYLVAKGYQQNKKKQNGKGTGK